MVGIKYQTFASWVQKRRRARKQYPAASTVKALPSMVTDALRLVEAVVDPAADKEHETLLIHLPGGARVEVHDGRPALLAAELLKALTTAARPF